METATPNIAGMLMDERDRLADEAAQLQATIDDAEAQLDIVQQEHANSVAALSVMQSQPKRRGLLGRK